MGSYLESVEFSAGHVGYEIVQLECIIVEKLAVIPNTMRFAVIVMSSL